MRTLVLIILFSLPVFATNRYVKNGGSDEADGLSDGNAWATLAKASGESLTGGDTLFLKKGSVWRECFEMKWSGSAGSPIVVTSYGTGADPILYGSLDKSIEGDWENDAGNIWKSTAKYTYYSWGYADIGNIVFDGGTSCGVKRNSSTGQCVAQGDFFYNRTDSLLYIYSVGNPATVYTQIDVCPRFLSQTAPMAVIAIIDGYDYITIHGLDFKYGGASGLWLDDGATNIIVENCDFDWIGGAYTAAVADSLREGNAVQIWCAATDITVRYCTFDQIYDAAISPQGSGVYAVNNLRFHHNLISKATYAFEFWARATGTTADSILFDNNTCVNTGGWSTHQRSDSTSLKTIRLADCIDGTLSNIFLRNNIFDSTEVVVGAASTGGSPGKAVYVDYWYTEAQLAALTINYNSYRHTADSDMVYYNKTNYTPAQFATYQSASGQDANSRVGVSGFTSTSDFSLQSSSACVNAGASLGYTQDILGNPMYGTPDIGAYEYQPPVVTRRLWRLITAASPYEAFLVESEAFTTSESQTFRVTK